jgi:hypothetical protein
MAYNGFDLSGLGGLIPGNFPRSRCVAVLYVGDRPSKWLLRPSGHHEQKCDQQRQCWQPTHNAIPGSGEHTWVVACSVLVAFGPAMSARMRACTPSGILHG